MSVLHEVLKAIIYIRVSSEEQLQNMSLASQETVCREYCSKHGYDVVAVFREEGKSAKTTNRPEFQELIRYCLRHKNGVDLVVVHSVSRFSRNTADYLSTRDVLGKLRVGLRSVTEAFDDTPSGKFVETVMAANAQLDNDNKAVLTVERMKLALERGRWTHSPPLGYRKPRAGQDGPSLEEDPATAPLIRQAFELCATGRHSVSEIARLLTAMGLRGARGAAISSQSLGKQLRNPLYCGRMIVPSLNTDAQGDFEPIVTPELFAHVQSVLDRKPSPTAKYLVHNPDFPLKRTVRCVTCKKNLTGSWSRSRGRRYPYYHCPRSDCGDMCRIRRRVIEDLFTERLDRFALKPQFLGLFEAVLTDAWREAQREHAKHRHILKSRLEKLRRDTSKLEEAFIFDQKIDKQTYDEHLSRLRGRMREVEAELMRPTPEGLDISAVTRFAKTLLARPGDSWRAFDLDGKQRLQRLVFPKGIEFDGEMFRTAVTSPVFTALEASAVRDEGLASPTGIEPVLPP